MVKFKEISPWDAQESIFRTFLEQKGLAFIGNRRANKELATAHPIYGWDSRRQFVVGYNVLTPKDIMGKKFNYPPIQGTYRDNLLILDSRGFNQATTAEVIGLLACYDVQKGQYIKHSLLSFDNYHLGHAFRSCRGIYFNPPKDENGHLILKEERLESLLENCAQVEGCSFGENDFSFVPFEKMVKTTLKKDEYGVYPEGSTRGSRTWNFYSTGLARALESNTSLWAKNLNRVGFAAAPKGEQVKWDLKDLINSSLEGECVVVLQKVFTPRMHILKLSLENCDSFIGGTFGWKYIWVKSPK